MTIQEQQFRINKILFDGRGNVTSTPKKIDEIFTISENVKNQIKTIVINNLGVGNIFFGVLNTITDSTAGGKIKAGEGREFPMIDLNESPYFVSASPVEIGIEIWG